MKKRILSCLMALALCLTLLPTAALAEETEGTAQTSPAVEKAADPANGEIHIATGRKLTVMAPKFSTEPASSAPCIPNKFSDDNFFIFVFVVRTLDTF